MARRRLRTLAGNRLRRTSRQKGLFGNDRFWRTIFFLIYGRKLWRKVMSKEPEIVSVEDLQPGQRMDLLTIDPRTLRRKSKR